MSNVEKMRDLTEMEWQFLCSVFKTFADNGIVAPILRNYEDLPTQIGNDLDIFVRREMLPDAESLLISELEKVGGRIVKKYKKDTFTALWMQVGDAPLLHIDLFNGAFYWRGRCFEKDAHVEELAFRHELGFFVLSPGHQAFSMFVTSLVWGAFYKVDYGRTINELLESKCERDLFNRTFERNFFPPANLPFGFESQPDKGSARKLAHSMRKLIRWRWLRQANLNELCSIIRYWTWEIYNLARPSGSWAISTNPKTLLKDANALCSTKGVYGGVCQLRYRGKRLVGWLYFRLRHVQRRMARNELVVVDLKSDQVDSIERFPFSCPDYVLSQGDQARENTIDSFN